jgi:hypothetical protein
MDKENNNVVGRLDKQYHYEPGDQIMHSMSEEAGGNESGTHDSQGEDQGFLSDNSTAIATFSAAFVATFIISIFVARMWDEDEIKLHILNFLVNLLQTIARLTGGWALHCERTYNEYVNALH